MKSLIKNIFLVTVLFGLILASDVRAIELDARKLVPSVDLFFSPRTSSFVEGSTFEVPIYIDTQGVSINSIEVRLKFSSDKLTIVNPSGGVSIIGVWIESPNYDNTKGVASYVGVIPNGIKTSSGLIGTITFKAKSTGKASLSFSSDSSILLNDGLGTEAVANFNRAEYNILAKAPEGVVVYSETHPSQNEWYNNNSPYLSWDLDRGVEGFSYEVDDKPFTVPDNTIDTEDTSVSFENMEDGMRYFHIKSKRGNAWGSTGHFLMKIDTKPPAVFEPSVNYLMASTAFIERALVTFFTTDSHSGIKHYEIGVIDKNQPTTQSPVFIEAQSPYQVPFSEGSNLEVVVRAIDNAGNIRDVSVSVLRPSLFINLINDYLIYILLVIIIIGFISLMIHYIYSHHMISRIKRASEIIEAEEKTKL